MKIIDNIISYIKKNSVILILFVVYIIFHIYFEQLIISSFLNTFFSSVQSSILNDILFYISIVIIIIRCFFYIKNRYSISSRYTLISLVLLLVIIYYRIFENPWQLISLSVCEGIKYIDAIILFFISNIIIKLPKKQSLAVNTREGFYFDNPIQVKKDDKFNRSNLALLLSDKIENTANFENSFAIGISSEWGHGKTSFLNLIKENIANKGLEKNKKNRIIVEFNPWLNNDEKAIVSSFFNELSSQLKIYNIELSQNIIEYSAELLKTIDSGTVSKILPIKDFTYSLRKHFEEINKAITLLGYQIIVFIDDLDRLYENEIAEVLKLIRNSASFSNTIFIVAYDRNYLISALKKVNDYRTAFYLEKIFQLEITLPLFEKHVFKKIIKEQIEPHLTKDDKEKFESLVIDSNFHSLFYGNYFNMDLLTNIRDVNRFSNSFIISYQMLKGEISILDLLNLEIVRIKYLGVYNLLANKYNDFLKSYTYQATKHFLSLAKVNENKNENLWRKETDKTILEEYLNEKYQEVGIQKNQINDVIKHVYAVFPYYNHLPELKDNHLSIANSLYIARYFHYSLLNSNLSEVEFSKYRVKPIKDFFNKIDEWINKGLLSEVKNRLEGIELFSNKEDYEKVIRAIFYFASKKRDKEEYRYIDFDYSSMSSKLDYKNVSAFYTSKEEFKLFINNLFNEQEEPYIIISKFIVTLFEKLTLEFILPKDELLKYKIKYFKEYSSKTLKFDKPIFWLFNYCDYKEWESSDGSRYTAKERTQNDAKKLFIDCARRIPESFIINIISEPNHYTNDREKDNPKLYSVLNQMIVKAWDTYDDFEAFIFSLDEEKVKGLSEFKDFYAKCKADDFRYIEYSFKEIDLSNAILFSN